MQLYQCQLWMLSPQSRGNEMHGHRNGGHSHAYHDHGDDHDHYGCIEICAEALSHTHDL